MWTFRRPVLSCRAHFDFCCHIHSFSKPAIKQKLLFRAEWLKIIWPLQYFHNHLNVYTWTINSFLFIFDPYLQRLVIHAALHLSSTNFTIFVRFLFWFSVPRFCFCFQFQKMVGTETELKEGWTLDIHSFLWLQMDYTVALCVNRQLFANMFTTIVKQDENQCCVYSLF